MIPELKYCAFSAVWKQIEYSKNKILASLKENTFGILNLKHASFQSTKILENYECILNCSWDPAINLQFQALS